MCIVRGERRNAVSAALTAVFILAAAVGVAAFSARDPHTGAIAPGTLASAGLLVIMALACLYYAGPRELRFDTAARRYEMVRGFPVVPVRRTGPFDDIKGVRIETNATGRYSGRVIYYLLLEWHWQVSRSPFALVWSLDRQAVLETMQELSERLGIPIAPF